MTVVINGTTGISPVTASGTSASIDGMTVGRGGGEVSSNTAVGASALASNTTAADNTAVGYQAAYNTTTDGENTAIGHTAFYSNTTGNRNVAVGKKALYSNTGADGNTAVGYEAALNTTTSELNAAFGFNALRTNTTGGNNTALGSLSLYSNTTASYSTAVGYQAGYSNTTGRNSSIGSFSLYSNTTGTNNTALGDSALYGNTTGGSNIAIGTQALNSNTTASNNTAVGYQAGYTQTTARWNTFIGSQAGYSVTTGEGNTFVGNGYSPAGYSMTTGSKNTIIGGYGGNQGGLDIRTSSNYIVISDGDGNPNAYHSSTGGWSFGLGGTTAGSFEGSLRLNGVAASNRGAALQGDSNGTNSWNLGDYAYVVSGTSRFFAVSNSGGGGVYLNGSSATSWTAVSDETRKIIIEPITDAASKVATLRTVIGRLKSDDETVRRPYLIAQDVQAVLPEAVSAAEDKDGPLLGLSYTEVIPLLVAAIKELKAEFDAYKSTHP